MGFPSFLKANIPIYGGPLALALIKGKLEEHGLLQTHNSTKLMLIQSLLSKYERDFLPHYSLQFQNLSVLSSIHLKVKLLCTGDFKFDHTSGELADLHRMAALGERRRSLPPSDSTNAEVPTFTNSEKVVGQSIMKSIEGIHGRILFSPHLPRKHFPSSISCRSRCKTGRKIVVFGRSMEKPLSMGLN